MITYPVSESDRFTFKLNGTTKRRVKWTRADGMPINDPEPGLVILKESIAPIPAYNAATHKLNEGEWIDDEANQTATFTFSVVPLSELELSEVAANQDRSNKRVNLSQAIATLRQWSDQAETTTVTNGNAVQTLQLVVNRLGVFFDRFADLLEVQRLDQ
jgi:hypothetical protein